MIKMVECAIAPWKKGLDINKMDKVIASDNTIITVKTITSNDDISVFRST